MPGHWDRCIALAKEPVVWFFSDDDLMPQDPSSSTNKSGLSRSSAQRPERLRSGSTITAADGCSSASMSGSSPASPGVRDGDTCNGNSGGCALYPRDSTTARRPRASLQPSSQSTTGVLPVPPHAMFPTETHWHAGRNAGEPSFSHFALRAASIRRYSNETGVSRGLSTGGSPCGGYYRSWLCSFLRCGSLRRKIWSILPLTAVKQAGRGLEATGCPIKPGYAC